MHYTRIKARGKTNLCLIKCLLIQSILITSLGMKLLSRTFEYVHRGYTKVQKILTEQCLVTTIFSASDRHVEFHLLQCAFFNTCREHEF